MADESDQRGDGRPDDPVYVISVAAELAGVHPQTLRSYEREGLVDPQRSSGNARRYSDRDLERLNEIQRLTQEEGLNLAGVRMVLDLRESLRQMRERADRLERELDQMMQRMRDEVAAAHQSHRFELVPLQRGQIEIYRRRRRP